MEMITIYKGFKFRLYPNSMQKEKINKTFGYNRFVYNHYLNQIRKEGYKNVNYYIKDYTTNLKYAYPFLKEANPILIRKTLYRLEDNYKRYLNSSFGYPKYKSKYAKNSYTITLTSSNVGPNCQNVSLDLKNKRAELPELGRLKIKGYRHTQQINGRIANYTISREKNGKYYISLLFELATINKIVPSVVVGLDLGIKKLITLSDGITYNNNKYITKYETKIKKEQQNLSRKQKGSKNYYKNLKKINVLYVKLSNSRKYYTHSITKEITDNYDIISTESLTTKKMIMNKQNHLSKNIVDVTLSEILRQLEYKSNEKGKYFYKISPYYPSSQTCSVCGNIDRKYKNLDERIYKCDKCQSILDRDYNASINIMFEGLKLYMKDAKGKSITTS